MLPPGVTEQLRSIGHEAATPADLGSHSLPDSELIQIATADGWVIVTENASDFARAATCSVLLLRKSWWPRLTLAANIAVALDRWAAAHPAPGPWAHWLDAELR